MSNQEIQRVAEFHVFERNLYQMPQRAPLRNGILDTRLVRRRRRRRAASRALLALTQHCGCRPPNRAPLTRRASARRARANLRTVAATTVRASNRQARARAHLRGKAS